MLLIIYLLLFFYLCGNSHPLAIKLNTLLKEGKFPKIVYHKFIDNTTSFCHGRFNLCFHIHGMTKYVSSLIPSSSLEEKGQGNLFVVQAFMELGREDSNNLPRFLISIYVGGPSINASRRYHAGYTTDSGVIKPHLASLYSFTRQPNAEVARLIETEKLQVIPVAQASDGTALKSVLEFDDRQKLIIGLVYKIDSQYVKERPLPEPEEIKNNLKTSTGVTYLTSLDNGATMPAAVNYLRKSVKGEELLASLEDVVKTV